MDKTILTLRHSATDSAKHHVILGQIDQDINDEGRELINEFLDRYGTVKSDHVVSSPLGRALHTARAVTGRTINNIKINRLCIERDYGIFQGMKPEKVPHVSPKTYYVDVNGIGHSLNPPGGETLEEVRKRADAFLKYLFGLPGTVLVVSHQCFLMQLHGAISGEDCYNALSFDVGILDLNRFEIHGRTLKSHELLYSSSCSGYESW
jgi:probable phosphoglycerate mutase